MGTAFTMLDFATLYDPVVYLDSLSGAIYLEKPRPHPVSGCGRGSSSRRGSAGGHRWARFTAETTARSEAVTVEVSMPAPQKISSPTAHSR